MSGPKAQHNIFGKVSDRLYPHKSYDETDEHHDSPQSTQFCLNNLQILITM